MPRLALLPLLLLLCTTLLSCNSLDIPPAPDLQPVLEAYANPSAEVTSEIMAAAVDAIVEARDDFENSDIYEEILNVVISVQDELDDATDDQGNVTIDGVGTFPSPNGAIAIDFICTGWGENETTDPANGTLELTMTLNAGSVGRIVWGTAADCKYVTTVAGRRFENSYDGTVALDLGEPVATGQSLRELVVTFVIAGTLGINGNDSFIDQSFRISEGGRLDVLVELDDHETFTFFFDGESFAQGIDDASGLFGCSLEARLCTKDLETSFSW